LCCVPGVYVRQPSKDRVSLSSRNNIQAFSVDTLVLIDGCAQYFPATNNVVWHIFPLAIEDIERIEII
jgi:hypothetical protein